MLRLTGRHTREIVGEGVDTENSLRHSNQVLAVAVGRLLLAVATPGTWLALRLAADRTHTHIHTHTAWLQLHWEQAREG